MRCEIWDPVPEQTKDISGKKLKKSNVCNLVTAGY